jgi:NAD+--dinitrogen-reductase ADP-D-ribosyltransferase
MASMQSASADPDLAAGDAGGWYLQRSAILNRCNLSPWAIASQVFQDDPRPIDIAWVRDEHAGMLELLGRLDHRSERAELFHHYVLTRPWAHEERDSWPDERERLRRSYVAVLRGWGIDSNGASGAVLKGWAEDRFGLRAIWHRTALSDADAQERFAAERMRGAAGGIGTQLDLLYAYAQDELRRRHPGERWLTLWRGSHDAEAYVVKAADSSEQIVEFNNVSSFTRDREVAWEFGSRVWEVRVPLAKIVCFPGLLPAGLLQGEDECIVLGGDYRVRVLVH